MSSKSDLIEIKCIVVQALRNTNFIVEDLETKCQFTAYASGKVRKNRIRICVNDIVSVEVSASDPNNGRIKYRMKQG